ncbi:MAG TPA: hypothetical protein VMQ44_03645, partial [Candidatus Saccharimonadales bacterium]|nr:hypothetical protein [Candidatus Saccharimonadales bacterium]
VVRTRLVPYDLPANGQSAQMVLTDWVNTSDVPAGAAYADITAYDADVQQHFGGQAPLKDDTEPTRKQPIVDSISNKSQRLV